MNQGILSIISYLEEVLPYLWSPATSAVPKDWDENNPAVNQCSTTALLVNDLFGGDIVIVGYTQANCTVGQHYFNLVPGHGRLDLTSSQFQIPTSFKPGIEASEEELREFGAAYLARRGYANRVQNGFDNKVMRDNLLSDQAVRKGYTALRAAYKNMTEEKK